MSGPEGQRTLAVDPDAAALRGVRWRLAALTVGLVCTLLLALGTIVYATTQHVLMDSLRTAVRDRADSMANRLSHDTYGGAGISPGHLHALLSDGGAGVLLVVADTNLVVQASNGPSGQNLADPDAAHQALQGNLSSPYSTRQIDASGPYLVYTESLIRDDGSVAGVVQTTLSEHQYTESMDALLRIDFSNGMSISVEPDEKYEAWNVSGPHGFLVVALPGGGIATWRSKGNVE